MIKRYCKIHHSYDTDNDGLCGAYASAKHEIRQNMDSCEFEEVAGKQRLKEKLEHRIIDYLECNTENYQALNPAVWDVVKEVVDNYLDKIVKEIDS